MISVQRGEKWRVTCFKIGNGYTMGLCDAQGIAIITAGGETVLEASRNLKHEIGELQKVINDAEPVFMEGYCPRRMPR